MNKGTMLISSEMFGGALSGVTVWTLHLRQVLVEMGFRVLILSAKYPTYPLPREFVIELPSVRLVPWSKHRFVSRALFFSEARARVLRKIPLFGPKVISRSDIQRIAAQIPDLAGVIAMGPYQGDRIAALIAQEVGRQQGRLVPTMMILHTMMELYLGIFLSLKVGPLRIPAPCQSFWVRLGLRDAVRVSRGYHRVFALSHALRTEARRWGIDAEHTLSAVLPIEPPKQTENQTRLEFGLPMKAPICLYVGRVTDEKNIEELIDAFVLAGNPRGEVLVLAGDGKLKRFRKYARKKCQKAGIDPARIIFLGHVNREEIGKLLAIAYLFVTASLTENLPLVLIEALQFAVAIVAIAAGGIPEVCGIAGKMLILYDTERRERVRDLARNLALVLANSELRRELSVLSRQRYLEAGYDMHRFTERALVYLGLAPATSS